MKFFNASRKTGVADPCALLSHFSGCFTGSASRIGSSCATIAGVIGIRSRGSLGKKCSLCSASSRSSSAIGSTASYTRMSTKRSFGAEVAAVLPDYEERRALHAALVTSAGLAGLERRHQPVREAAPAPLEGLGQVLHGLVRHHDVRLGRIAVPHDHLPLSAGDVAGARRRTDPTAGPVEGAGAGEAGRVSVRVDDPDLPVLQHGVGPHHNPERLFRRGALGHEIEPALAVGGVTQALRRHRPHPGAAPRHDSAHVRELRLDRDTQVARDRIVGHDAVGVGELLEMGGGDDGLLGGKRGRT